MKTMVWSAANLPGMTPFELVMGASQSCSRSLERCVHWFMLGVGIRIYFTGFPASPPVDEFEALIPVWGLVKI